MSGSAEKGGSRKVIEVADEGTKEKVKTSKDTASKEAATAKAAKEEKPAAESKKKEKEVTPATPAASKTAGTAARPARSGEGTLHDEVLTQIAQSKYEAQEDKVRDVAKGAMALLRDYPKLSAADANKRIAEIRKNLLKYEMNNIRAWEMQERRRRVEIEGLEAEAQKCHQEADDEVAKTAELRLILEREKRRRKRYESYEEAATEVNKKRSRVESQAKIDAEKAEIARLQKQHVDLEALAEARHKRAHLLQHSLAELRADIQTEQRLITEALDGSGGKVDGEKSSTAKADPVEIIS